MRITNPNLEILELAVHRLDDLIGRLVLLGGCATGLLLTDSAAPPVRATQDVDVLTEVATLSEYYGLTDKLREKGFREDSSEDAPICRMKTEGVILDVMPTDPDILGFGSAWYQEAMDNAVTMKLPSGKQVRMITAPYFLACKFAAFDSRGENDFMSHDMEDIVVVIDGRPEVLAEISQVSRELLAHLVTRFRDLLNNPEFVAALSGLMHPDQASQERIPIIKERMNNIVALGE